MYKNTTNRPQKNIAKYIVILLVVVVALTAILSITFKNKINKPYSNDDSIVILKIETGETRDEIAKSLVEKQLIKSADLFVLYLRISGKGGNFMAGNHKLTRNMSIIEIVDTLAKTPNAEMIAVTIPEGYTFTQIAEVLESEFSENAQTEFSKEEFLNLVQNPDQVVYNSSVVKTFVESTLPEGKSLEGFLYPETYYLGTAYDANAVINTLVSQLYNEIKASNINVDEKTFYDSLTLASIVERESLNELDRGNVASVFSNRLAIGMLLQSDATVNYALGKSERRPTFADIETDSPYNTYKYVGLPPTPISNPRIESIELSINPPETDYYYFIHEPDGTPHFGETENDHYKNVCKYLDKTC